MTARIMTHLMSYFSVADTPWKPEVRKMYPSKRTRAKKIIA
jgi:hypothetical protein